MAVLAIAAVGAGIGASAFAAAGATTVLGMSGAGWGWMIGSLVGSMLFRPKGASVEGPRIDDRRVTGSDYGAAIPKVYSTITVPGDYIWTSDLNETVHHQEVGGKGGGSSSSSTTYTYDFHAAVLVCAGPIHGISRIWANGRLIYDQRASSGASSAIVDTTIVTEGNIRVYTGTETQTPDSIMESILGAGNVPAHRGYAYTVFESFQLEKFGNRPPTFTFEVCTEGSVEVFTPYAETVGNGAGKMAQSTVNNYICAATGLGAGYIDIIDPANETTVAHWEPVEGNPASVVWHEAGQEWWVGFNGGIYILPADGSSYEVADTSLHDGDTTFNAANIAISADTDLMLVAAGEIAAGPGAGCYLINPRTRALVANVTDNGVTQMGSLVSCDGASCFAGSEYANPPRVRIVNALTGTLDHTINITEWTGDNGLGDPSLAWDSTRDRLIAKRGGVGGACAIIDVSAGTYSIVSTPDWGGDFGFIYHPGRDTFFALDNGVGIGHLYEVNASTLALIEERQYTTTVDDGDFPTGRLLYTAESDSYLYSEHATTYDVITRIWLDAGDGLTCTTVPWQDVVEDLCLAAGLEADQISLPAVVDPDDMVEGYRITTQTSARGAIEPLQQTYYFDAVESGTVLKFVKRGGASVVTIPEDDLGAYSLDGDAPDANMELTHGNGLELPREVVVRYLRAESEYGAGTQYDRRTVVPVEGSMGLELPMVLSDDKAIEVAQVNLYAIWLNRDGFMIPLMEEYIYLEPTDVITVLKNDGTTYKLRLMKIEDNARVRQISAVSEDTTVYVQGGLAPAVPVPPSESEVTTTGATVVLLMNLPALTESNDDSGFYYTVYSSATGWTGATLYMSADGGTTYTAIDTTTARGVTGRTTTVLGDYSGSHIFDETNSVTVTLHDSSNTLSSVTELAALGFTNAAVVGDEILIFKNATLVSPGTYKLTGLLRYLRGTNHATGHTVGERFVLLETSTIKRITSVPRDLERLYKIVTDGQDITEATSSTFTNTAEALKPFSPVQLGGGRDASNNLTITWVRRDRMDFEWQNSVSTPMSEDTESYEVDIYSDNTYTTVVRTISASSESASYSAANQTTDFGSPQATVYCKVYQLSATVGRGYPLTGSV